MELVFVTVIGMGIALIARYAIAGRTAYGVLLLPAVGGAVTAGTWVSLVWLGLRFDGGWIWAISIAAATAASIAVAVLLPRRRQAADDARFRELAAGH